MQADNDYLLGFEPDDESSIDKKWENTSGQLEPAVYVGAAGCDIGYVIVCHKIDLVLLDKFRSELHMDQLANAYASIPPTVHP